MRVWYDQEGDVLEVQFEGAPGYMEEIEPDVFERRTPDGRIIGILVLNLSRHDRDQLKLPLVVTAIHIA